MQFLTPLFLAGLVAIGVPLWLHLIRKEQALRIPFSSLMYVPPREMKLVRRQQLRQWPLFLLRLLLIVLLVLAFSRPYWRQFSGAWASSSLARIVLLDNSFSMRSGDRFSAARAMAEREIRSAPRGSEITLAVVSDRVNVLNEPGEPPEALLTKLKQVEASFRATRLDQGIQVAGDIMKQSRMGNREIVVVSDFQKSGLHLSSWAVPEGVGLRTIAVAPPGDNVFVENVQAPSEVYHFLPGNAPGAMGAKRESAMEDFMARVQNAGNSDLQNAPVELRMEDRVVQSQHVTIPAKSSRLVHFSPPEMEDKPVTRFVVTLGASDSLPDDNQFFFAVRRQQKIALILSAEGAALLFLKEALNSPGVPWEVRSDLSAESLRRSRVLVLHDPANIQTFIPNWVQEGGTLLIFSGARSENLKSQLLPVMVQGSKILRRERDIPVQFTDIQWQHPVFQIFADQQKRYFNGVHFYGYTEAAAIADSKILARFDSESPALVEKNFGRGRVLWFASSASNDWNNFAVRPVFLPFVQTAVAYLAGARKQLVPLRVGEVLDLTPWGDSGVAVIDPRGQRLTVAEGHPLVELEQPGFYEVRYNRLSDYVAVNIPASESNLETAPVDQVQGHARNARAAAAEVSAASMEHRQSLWRILLFVLVLVMLGEWVAADLYYGRRPARPGEVKVG
jgi:hypothetical protein